jgi:UDP-N-acetylmuramate--alanine ligase
MQLCNLEKGLRIHFIGIGGVSMSGLAYIANSMGYSISGSDSNDNDMVEKLKKDGFNVFIGHKAENVDGANLVVYTAAIKEDNPELVEAKKKNIPVMERSEFLGELTKHYSETIGICGTHGKTTTTSMASLCFLEAGKDPSVQVGANFDAIGGNYRVGNSPYFIIESCEYVESFLKFFPKSIIMLNIEEDHLDYFRDINHIKSAFEKFATKVPSDGVIVYNADNQNCIDVMNKVDKNKISFAINNNMADWVATDIKLNDTGFYSYVATNGKESLSISLNVVGYHNVMNSLSVVVLAKHYGIDNDTIISAIANFRGASRRFEYKGTLNGARVFDDYAHHPTEIKATISSALTLPHNKIWVVFQPHTYSRTKSLWDEFSTCFSDVDNLLLLDIYAAREQFDGETTSEGLAQSINENTGNCLYIDSFDSCVQYLKENAQNDDIVITVGAGDVTKISNLITK